MLSSDCIREALQELLARPSGEYLGALVELVGPSDDVALEVSVSIYFAWDEPPRVVQRWFSAGTDLRANAAVAAQVLQCIGAHGVASVRMADHVSCEYVYASFWVQAETLPLDEISAVLGCAPTRAWRKGDPGQYNPSIPFSTWKLDSPVPRSTLRIDEHVAATLAILEARSKQVENLSRRFSVGLSCVGHFRRSSPSFHLEASLVRRLASLGLSVDFDLYCDCE